MDKNEAKKIIVEQLQFYRGKTYQELVLLVSKEPIAYDLIGKNGVKYQVEIQTFWDDKPKGDIRIIGSIDNGGLRALLPITACFIKDPENRFVGE